ncbi:MAG TPA: hypothetical protein VK046_08160 [Actinomycetaceae bacterium]|nr:hypothetical protein [Actinomycetaceae bacterium]
MTPPARRRPPASLVLALLLVVVELGALAALTGGMVVELVAGRTVDPLFTSITAAVFIGLIVLLALAVRALHQGRRWGRGPVITWQLLVLAIGISQAGALVWWLAALLIAIPVAVVVGTLVPPSVAWAHRTGPPRAVL